MKFTWAEAAIGAALGWWFGLDLAVRVMLIMMGLDVFSGLVVAWRRKTVDSDVFWDGITKKILALLIVFGAWVLTPLLPIESPVPLLSVVAGFYAAHNALSLVENAALMGVPMPPLVVDALKKLSGSGKLATG